MTYLSTPLLHELSSYNAILSQLRLFICDNKESKMSANTKYQPAPQRDSFEEGNYSQAPPSYQAEGHNNDDLLGAPRSEDDNVPDDFKVRYYT